MNPIEEQADLLVKLVPEAKTVGILYCSAEDNSCLLYTSLLPYLVSVIMMRVAMAIPLAIGNEVFITYIGLGLPVSTPSPVSYTHLDVYKRQ